MRIKSYTGGFIMATNLERLQNCSARQLEAFIRSIVSKRASEYINWGAWLSSDDPDVVFLLEVLLQVAGSVAKDHKFLHVKYPPVVGFLRSVLLRGTGTMLPPPARDRAETLRRVPRRPR